MDTVTAGLRLGADDFLARDRSARSWLNDQAARRRASPGGGKRAAARQVERSYSLDDIIGPARRCKRYSPPSERGGFERRCSGRRRNRYRQGACRSVDSPQRTRGAPFNGRLRRDPRQFAESELFGHEPRGTHWRRQPANGLGIRRRRYIASRRAASFRCNAAEIASHACKLKRGRRRPRGNRHRRSSGRRHQPRSEAMIRQGCSSDLYTHQRRADELPPLSRPGRHALAEFSPTGTAAR